MTIKFIDTSLLMQILIYSLGFSVVLLVFVLAVNIGNK